MTAVSEACGFLASETEMAAGIPGLQLSVRAARGRFAGRPSGAFHDQVALSGGRWGLAVGQSLALQPPAVRRSLAEGCSLGGGCLLAGGCSRAGGAGVARTVLRAMALTDTAPSVVLAGMNRALLTWSLAERSCLAVAYAEVGPAWRGVRVQACVAGLPAAFVRRARGKVKVVGSPGQCLGAAVDARLSDARVTLRAGDSLVLVSAGVPGAVGGAGPICEILATSGGGSAARTTAAVLAGVRAAAGGQVDHEVVVLALKLPLRRRNAGTHAAGWPSRTPYSGS